MTLVLSVETSSQKVHSLNLRFIPYPEMSGHQSCKSYIVPFLLNELYSAT